MENLVRARPLLPGTRFANPNRIRRLFSGSLQRVALRPEGALGTCYWTASEIASKYGGSVVCGYRITEHVGVMIEGEHHAVVKLSDGSLLDVTAYQYSDHEIGFVADGTECPALDFPTYKNHVTVPLGFKSLVNALDVAHKKACIAQRARARVAYEEGVPFVPGAFAPVGHSTKLDDAIRHEAKALQKHREAKNALWDTVVKKRGW